MNYVVITRGARWKDPNAASRLEHMRASVGEALMAHYLDPDEVEDRAHQVSNFITYAVALGVTDPLVVVVPEGCPESMGDEWTANVVSALSVSVVRG